MLHEVIHKGMLVSVKIQMPPTSAGLCSFGPFCLLFGVAVEISEGPSRTGLGGKTILQRGSGVMHKPAAFGVWLRHTQNYRIIEDGKAL